MDFKISIKKWTSEDLKERLRYLNNEIPFMFMPPDISKNKVKIFDDIMNDAEKIRIELKKRGEIWKK